MRAKLGSAYVCMLDRFAWAACGYRTTLGPCQAQGCGLGGRCAAHGGTCLPVWARPVVLAAQLRTDFDEGVPLGPARVWTIPERAWTQLATDDEWPEHLLNPERDARGNRKRRWGRRQPECLEPRHGGWPRAVSGEIARQLCRKPGVVSRIIATAEFVDGWWTRELLSPDAEARIALRFADTSDATLAAELERKARADYRRSVERGWASWT